MLRRRVLVADAHQDSNSHALVDVLLNTQMSPSCESNNALVVREESPPLYRPSTFAPYQGHISDNENDDDVKEMTVTPHAHQAAATPTAEAKTGQGPYRVVVLGAAGEVVAEWQPTSSTFAPCAPQRRDLQRFLGTIAVTSSKDARRKRNANADGSTGKKRPSRKGTVRRGARRHYSSSPMDEVDAPRATSPRGVATTVQPIVVPPRPAVRLEHYDGTFDTSDADSVRDVPQATQATDDGDDSELELLVRPRLARGDPRSPAAVEPTYDDGTETLLSRRDERTELPRRKSLSRDGRVVSALVRTPRDESRRNLLHDDESLLAMPTTRSGLERESLMRLKARLRYLGLPVTGIKTVLVERLLDFWNPHVDIDFAMQEDTPQVQPPSQQLLPHLQVSSERGAMSPGEGEGRSSFAFVRRSIQAVTSLFGWGRPSMGNSIQRRGSSAAASTAGDQEDADGRPSEIPL